MEKSQVQEMDQLINLACGPRSIAEFADDCKISRAHLFRMKKGVRPSRKLCKRIAEDKYVKQIGLTCEDIYKAAGYNDNADIFEAQQHEELTSYKGYEKVDLGIVTHELMESKFMFQLLPVGEDQDVNFAFKVKKGRKNLQWKFIELKEKLLDAESRQCVNAFYHNFGRMLSLSPLDQEQYTLILHDEEAYNQLSKAADSAPTKGRISIVLIDYDKMIIKKEIDVGFERVFFHLTAIEV